MPKTKMSLYAELLPKQLILSLFHQCVYTDGNLSDILVQWPGNANLIHSVFEEW